ncbi:MAG: hypothetical protein QXV06_05310 [Ignisphaera sp.]
MIISLPKKFDALNITNVDNYYLEVGCSTEGVIEIVKMNIDLRELVIKLSAKDLDNVLKKWLEHYRNYGKLETIPNVPNICI